MAAAVWGFIVAIAFPLVVKVLTAAGVSYLTFSGAELGIDAVTAFVQTQLSGLPAYMIALFGILQFDRAIEILMAAYSARIALQAVNGVFTKFRVAAPAAA